MLFIYSFICFIIFLFIAMTIHDVLYVKLVLNDSQLIL